MWGSCPCGLRGLGLANLRLQGCGNAGVCITAHECVLLGIIAHLEAPHLGLLVMVGVLWWLGALERLRRLMPGLRMLFNNEARARERLLRQFRHIHLRVTRTDDSVYCAEVPSLGFSD